ncbi:hypothetical protein ACTXT7_011950 [Hymenolepis weldensis]
MFEDRNIENLDSNIIRNVSRYLGVQDLENVLVAIPGWRKTIEAQMKQRRIRGFTWLDEEMYKLLIRRRSYVGFANSDEMIEYYTTHRELLVPERPIESCGKLKILFLYHELNAGNAEMWNDVFDMLDETPDLRWHLGKRIHQVRIISMNIPSMVFENITNESKMTYAAISRSIMQVKALSELYLSRIAPFDVLFYFVDYSKPVVDALKFLRRALTPRHTLIISVIRNPKDSTWMNMGYLNNLISIIGEFIDRDLKNSQIRWRLWCMDRDSNGRPNFREILEWFSARWNNN